MLHHKFQRLLKHLQTFHILLYLSAEEILPSCHFWNMHFFPRSHCSSLPLSVLLRVLCTCDCTVVASELMSPLNGSWGYKMLQDATSIAFYMLCFCSRTSTSWFSLPKYHVTYRQGTEASPPQALELGAALGHERPRRWTQSVAPCDAIPTVVHASFMASKNRCIETYHLLVDIW